MIGIKHKIRDTSQCSDLRLGAVLACLCISREFFQLWVTADVPALQLLYGRMKVDVEHLPRKAGPKCLDLPLDPSAVIKKADLRVLAAEQAQIMAPGTADWAAEAGISPAPIVVQFLRPEVAKHRFLERFEWLRPATR